MEVIEHEPKPAQARLPAIEAPVLPAKLMIGKAPVSTNADGLISLTDLWKAAGGENRNRPGEWLKTDGVRKFVGAVANGEDSRHFVQTKPGPGGGTFAHWQIALAYAKWLSPALHMQVNEVFMRYKSGDATLAEEVIEKTTGLPRTVLWTDPR